MATTLVFVLSVACNVFGADWSLENGTMTDGDKLPSGWSKPAVDAGSTGKLLAERDTSVYVKGPASIRLESAGGPVSGKMTQMLKGVGGRSLEFSGHVRRQGSGAATVALIGFDADYKALIGWKELVRITGDSDWRPFGTRVDFPIEVKRALLLLYVQGEGKSWFDEIAVAPAPEKPPARPVAEVPPQRVLFAFDNKDFTFAFNDFEKGVEKGTDMLTWWVLANGILAGCGALIALGHPLTVLSSILAAPLTSLNPMIAAGWVSGLVEAFSRKPKVKDFEHLPNDILSVRGFWRNKVTRILLVVVFTNLGSAAGTFVAIPMMMKYL